MQEMTTGTRPITFSLEGILTKSKSVYDISENLEGLVDNLKKDFEELQNISQNSMVV